MEVILVQPLKKIGNIGSIINVKTGFAKNFLLPKNIAIRATLANKELIKQQALNFEEKNKTLLIEAKHLLTNIIGKEISFIQECADDGRLFGSVNRKNIAKNFESAYNLKISIDKIILKSPIKNVGVYEVEIALHHDVFTNILVNVARSETEAQHALKTYKDTKVSLSEAQGEENK